MSDLSPAERRLRKQIAANTRWAYAQNRTVETAPARAAAEARFEKLVDPDGRMSPAARKVAAASARTLFYQRIAAKSAESRRKRRAA